MAADKRKGYSLLVGGCLTFLWLLTCPIAGGVPEPSLFLCGVIVIWSMLGVIYYLRPTIVQPKPDDTAGVWQGSAGLGKSKDL